MIVKPIFYIVLIFLLFACKSSLDLSKYNEIKTLNETEIQLDESIRVSLSVIETAFVNTNQALVFKGGKNTKKERITYSSILIQHPKGNFLIDAGLGDETAKHIKENFPLYARLFIKNTLIASVKDQLIFYKFNPDLIHFILPTHLHYDHAGGIEEFKNISVLTTEVEYKNTLSESALEHGFITEQYDSLVSWDMIKFRSRPYSIFNESCDLFNDGTVVIVKLPGHTEGSIGVFVSLQSGQRYFFIGDAVWNTKGYLNPAEKHKLSRLTDDNRTVLNQSIVKLHYLSKLDSNLIIVPAHDFNVQRKMAQFPNVEY